MRSTRDSVFRRIAKTMGWTRSSYVLISAFLLLVGLIAYLWWPLAVDAMAYMDWDGPWWLYFDWLLVGIFLVMSGLIMSGADLRTDAWIVFVGFVGGLVIESWGTQTEIWWYYTAERPPMWIIPAWPIASLSIDRLVRFLSRRVKLGSAVDEDEPRAVVLRIQPRWITLIYWFVFPLFFLLMLGYVYSTLELPLTVMAVFLVGLLVLTPHDPHTAVLTFLAGSGLGYFLEYWGTTRECWTYYTLAKPPLFAVLAHGMAAVAFWRTSLVLQVFWRKIFGVRTAISRSRRRSKPPQRMPGS